MATQKSKKEIFEIKQEELSACGKKMNFLIKQENLSKESRMILSRFANQVNIPGFRRGKAPDALIRRKYEKEILEELRNHLFSLAIREIETGDNPDIVHFSNPEEKNELKLDEDFEFSFSFECAPEIELPDYKNIKIDIPEIAVSDEAIQEQIAHLGNMYGSYEDVDVAAESGDMLKASYTTDFIVDDEENAAPSLLRQVKSDDNWIWLSEPETIPGAIAALTGAKKGQDYEFTAEYPEDYREEALQGKKVAYKVHVKAVQRRKVLNEDELSKKMNFDSSEKLRDLIKTNIARDNEATQHDQYLEKLQEELLKQTAEFPLPEQLLAGETSNKLQEIAHKLIKNDEDANSFKEKMEEHKAEATTQAKEFTRLLFICRKIAAQEKVSVSDGEVNTQIKLIAQHQGANENEILSQFKRNGVFEDIRIKMLINKVLSHIKENAETAK